MGRTVDVFIYPMSIGVRNWIFVWRYTNKVFVYEVITRLVKGMHSTVNDSIIFSSFTYWQIIIIWVFYSVKNWIFPVVLSLIRPLVLQPIAIEYRRMRKTQQRWRWRSSSENKWQHCVRNQLMHIGGWNMVRGKIRQTTKENEASC